MITTLRSPKIRSVILRSPKAAEESGAEILRPLTRPQDDVSYAAVQDDVSYAAVQDDVRCAAVQDDVRCAAVQDDVICCAAVRGEV